ncbi:hypothetical protein VMCG_05626 [Cytospora schulzeri]|uniref:Uncharacterized protein n=1 Tax=Cytospora schulzeri TaxID=448051 RepID=A0A423WEY0_9PEZI|nr:hypothetical protein VMCG_05626 [Valsa malicola]
MKVLDNYPESPLQTMPDPTQLSPVRLVPYNPRWHWGKFTTRCFIILFSACIWGLLVIDDIWALVIVPVLISDIVWQFAELITLAFRRTKKRGIHPVAHLVIDLAHMLCYFAIAVLYSMVIYNIASFENKEQQKAGFIPRIVIDVFLFVQWIFHLLLFVRDCVEVNQRRRAKVAPTMMCYIPGQGAPFAVKRDSTELPPASSEAVPMDDAKVLLHPSNSSASSLSKNF